MRGSFFIGFAVFVAATALAEPPVEPTPIEPPARKGVASDSGKDGPLVLKLGVESGKITNTGRDNRVFTIPVTCGDAKTNFTWGCGGQTIISEGYAKLARLEIHPNDDLKAIVDGNGKPLFLGDSSIEVYIGGKSHPINAWIMRGGTFNKNAPGIIGYDLAKQFQWEIDPRVPQITLRAPGTEMGGKSLAVLPLKDDQDNLWIHIKVRGVEDDFAIMPQTADLQVSEALQKSWKVDPNTKEPDDLKNALGNKMQVLTMHDKDGIWLSSDLFETNFLCYLLGEDPNSRNAIGQSILNRYVYRVDASTKQFVLLEHVTRAPAKK